MKLAASVLVVVLAGCTGDGADNAGGANPETLWLAMTSGSAMKLVGEEPHPY